MKIRVVDRRSFLMLAGGAAGTGLLPPPTLNGQPRKPIRNSLPRWKGFNLLDFFSPNPEHGYARTTEQDLRWMRDWGFDFVRVPMAYPRYVRFDRSRNIRPEETVVFDVAQVDRIEELVSKAHEVGLHVSLNLHRAPGYCVNAGFHEPFNLWKDEAALEAFCLHWGMWAKRFKNVSSKKISFDLVNEPSTRDDMNDQHSSRRPVPGDVYRKVALAAAEAIRGQNADHLIVADGNDVGSDPIPEIADLKIGQSCRGYFPHYVSHYRAPWVFKNPDEAPRPVWPGEIAGQHFGRENLEEFYRPWIDLVRQGVGVHCGECGCWNQTPHQVFLAWFGDVLDILTENGIGFALWNFRGDFGVMDSQRSDVDYENWYGHKLDRKLLDILR